MANVLFVDHDPQVLVAAFRRMSAAGHRTLVAETGEAALLFAKAVSPHFAVVDVRLRTPGIDGVETARRLRSDRSDLPIVLTSSPSLDERTENFVDTDGFPLVEKPLDWEKLLDRVIATDRAIDRPLELPASARTASRVDACVPIIGESAPMRQVHRLIERIASSDDDVLVLGETGTGKELVALAVHRASSRRSGPFLPVNVAAVQVTVFDSEAFGHEAGTFTDARGRHFGWFEQAAHGSLFLDEIGDLPLEAQGRLLRVLECREIRRLGATHATSIDVRVIAATNIDLDGAVARGAFRADLFHRLTGTIIRLPPLRERGDDIRLLIEHFVAKAPHLLNQTRTFSNEALAMLRGYEWPGNVRQLANAIREAVRNSDEPVVGLDDLPAYLRSSANETCGSLSIESNLSLPEEVRQLTWHLEERRIREALEKFRGNQSAAARHLGIDRKTLRERIARYRTA